MTWSDLLKVLSGFFLAITLIVGGSYAAAQYLIAQFTAPPPKPIFPNERPVKPKAQAAVQVKPSASPAVQPSSSPSVTPSPKPSQAVGYRARIALKEGLNLRENPSRDANRIGGVDYNQQVTVLEESPEKEWQKIRLENGLEGWVKAGYADRIN